jgi:nucleotide-binding universal stress UspA family protein
MTIPLIVISVALVAALVAVGAGRVRYRARRPTGSPGPATGRRILFPFLANALSGPALEAALRLATAEGATLVPVFLARVALDLPLETPLPRQCALAVPLLEAIQHRATEAGVPVDARIERGRNNRHALRRAIADERFDRIVIAAAAAGSPGFDADEVAWLLDNAAGEIIVMRPSDEEGAVPVPPAAAPREQFLPAGSTSEGRWHDVDGHR